MFIGRTDEAETPILWPPVQRADSFEKTLMLGKIECRRRSGRQRMKWLNGITDLMDMGLCGLWELVMPSNHLILCLPLFLLLSIFPSIRVFSNESALRIRWPKYWNFSFSIIASKEHPGLISFRVDYSQESSPTPQFKSINSSAFSFLHSPTLTSMHDHWKNHSIDSLHK